MTSCIQCEFAGRCFPLLKLLNRVKEGYCQQGRKRKEYREKQATLPVGSDQS